MLSLESGLAEIELRSGTRLIMEGPATLYVEAPKHVRLDNGRVTATVPPKAAGFTVRTPCAAIVDRGTEFGVVVAPSGLTEVHVFAGAVAVHTDWDTTSSKPGKNVVAGLAVQVS